MQSRSDEEIAEPEVAFKSKRSQRTPLPKLQLFIVFLIQFTEPLTSTVIYPFVNQFVRDTGITHGDERRTGYYAGVIGSAFFFAEAVTVFHWGWVSDRIGRRPILLFGPIGLALAMLSFGISSKFWSLVVSRCVQGIFNGNIGVSKTVMAEITDSTNIADAFAMMPLTWSLGLTTGPIIGGLLAEPAKRWPALFGRFDLFHRHPYFLPCAAAGMFALAAALIAFLKLKETLPSALEKQRKKDLKQNVVSSYTGNSTTPLLVTDTEGYGTNSSAVCPSRIQREEAVIPPQKPVEKAPPFRSLLIPQLLIPFAVYMVQAFVDMSSQVLLPLMYSTSIPVGGLGMDAYHIGIILSVFGLVNAVVQLFLLARLIRWLGPRYVNAISQVGYLGNIGLYPLLSFFARRAGRMDAKVWAIIVVQLIFRLTNGMGYGSIQLVIVDNAPSRASLGATNGMAQALGSFTRSIGPSVASSLFSVSLERNLLGGNMVYIVLIGFALVGLRLSFHLPHRLRSQNE